MTDQREAFLAGERPDDVALYLSSSFLDDPGPLAEHGELVDGGVVLVVDGADGRRVFRQATGTEAMVFAREAMGTDGTVAPDLTGGACPAADGHEPGGDEAGNGEAGNGDEVEARDREEAEADNGDHEPLYVFAFAEARNEEAGGLYAEGDVVHAYAQCACGQRYSDRWVAGER